MIINYQQKHYCTFILFNLLIKDNYQQLKYKFEASILNKSLLFIEIF